MQWLLLMLLLLSGHCHDSTGLLLSEKFIVRVVQLRPLRVLLELAL